MNSCRTDSSFSIRRHHNLWPPLLLAQTQLFASQRRLNNRQQQFKSVVASTNVRTRIVAKITSNRVIWKHINAFTLAKNHSFANGRIVSVAFHGPMNCRVTSAHIPAKRNSCVRSVQNRLCEAIICQSMSSDTQRKTTMAHCVQSYRQRKKFKRSRSCWVKQTSMKQNTLLTIENRLKRNIRARFVARNDHSYSGPATAWHKTEQTIDKPNGCRFEFVLRLDRCREQAKICTELTSWSCRANATT